MVVSPCGARFALPGGGGRVAPLLVAACNIL
jgi:hypothetical protein